MIVEQPLIIGEQKDWQAIYPKVIYDFIEDYYLAIEFMDSNPKKAERILKKIISVCRDGHIDAILHLGLLYNEIGKPIEGNALIVKAYKLSMDAFPQSFKPSVNELHWLSHDNRPILRSIQAYGLELMKRNQYEKAVREFDFIIKINPNDNQGIRYLLIECYLHLGRLNDFLELDKLYLNEHSVEFLYGKVLALFLLNRMKEAEKHLKVAKTKFPFVVEELIKTEHLFPENEFEGQFFIKGYSYPIGSRQQAFDYWNITQELWRKAKGIREFLIGN